MSQARATPRTHPYFAGETTVLAQDARMVSIFLWKPRWNLKSLNHVGCEVEDVLIY
ncbi:hypothetical protein QJS10_CPB21g00130 [Acorus calamus]|uniref:Uncharacterized protein n=1 Tax=Acorus calamus TaxID=4465 RepID=A0AAV9C607_ACOCL|nr:hypothetical protein QJS10_CPB21g00130 [Acorus calamus]